MVQASLAMKQYTEVMMRLVSRAYPHLSPMDINNAINYSINKRYKEESAEIYNNYTKKKPIGISLLDLTDYIIDREPIIVASGVMFKRHGTVPNPLLKMVKSFMDNRGILKNKMFTYPKGSEEFEYYNLLQTLAKIDANGLYGVLGLYNSFYYDIHVAKSTTGSGRALVSTAGMQFEMFLSNGVKFGSLNQVMTFIDNVCMEERKWKDRDILDRNIDVEECFVKLVMSCGFEWIPDEDDLWLIYQTVTKLTQEDLNRVYYKNNLYEFMSNSKMTNMVLSMLDTLDFPYLNPNDPPEEIKEDLDLFCNILMEYVYYHHFFIDNIDRMDNMIKNVISLSDTDSTIVCVDAWYRFVSNIVKDRNLEFKIMHHVVDALKTIDNKDEYGRPIRREALSRIEPDIDYDFFNDEKVELKRTISPIEIIPQDNLRYSIINILAYCLGEIINDYMERYTKASNSYTDDKKCLIIMKNEF